MHLTSRNVFIFTLRCLVSFLERVYESMSYAHYSRCGGGNGCAHTGQHSSKPTSIAYRVQMSQEGLTAIAINIHIITCTSSFSVQGQNHCSFYVGVLKIREQLGLTDYMMICIQNKGSYSNVTAMSHIQTHTAREGEVFIGQVRRVLSNQPGCLTRSAQQSADQAFLPTLLCVWFIRVLVQQGLTMLTFHFPAGQCDKSPCSAHHTTKATKKISNKTE